MSESGIIGEIERQIDQLSYGEQLMLLRHLVHRLRSAPLKERAIADNLMAVMAVDPEIQREIKAINAEFLETDGDGLESLGS